MSLFQRSRRSDTPPPFQELRFVTSRNVLEKFDSRYNGSGIEWHVFRKSIEFKILDGIFTQLPSKDREDNTYQVLAQLPNEPKQLRILFKLDRTGTCFFAIDITLQDVRQANIETSLEIPICITILDTSPRGWSTIEFQEFVMKLAALQVQQATKQVVVNDEIRTWSKYLSAIEKITKDKSIIFKVKAPQKYTRKKKTYFEFPLDLTPYANRLQDILVQSLTKYPIAQIVIGEDRGQIEIQGVQTLQAEEGAAVEELLHQHFYQWSLPPSKAKRALRLEITPKFEKQAAQEARLKMLDGELSKVDINRTRDRNLYRFADWKSYTIWAEMVQKESNIWMPPTSAQAKIRLDFWLDNPKERKAVLDELGASLNGQKGLQNVVVKSDKAITVEAVAQTSPNLGHGKVRFLVTQASVAFQAGIVVLASEPTKELTATNGVSIQGETISISAGSREALQDRLSKFKMKNLEVVTPEFSELVVKYTVAFDYLENHGEWKAKLQKKLSSIAEIKSKGDHLLLNVQSAEQLHTICKKVEGFEPGLRCIIDEISAPIRFLHEDRQLCLQAINACKQKLTQAYGNNISFEPQEKKNDHLVGTLSLADVADWKPVMQALQQRCGSEMQTIFPNPEGCTVMEFVHVPKLLETFLSEKWKTLRGSTIKFLSENEHGEYQKEIAGKGGRYHGGNELGKLNSLRNGKVTIISLSEDSKQSPTLREGFLLPIFAGDLAQISRLKEAMGLLRQPKDGFPINRNLANFVFDAKTAKKIDLSPQLGSDHFLELRHKMNESALNPRQKEAVWKALESKDMVLVQGPPGTGKTTVIAEIVWQMLQENPDYRILITSQSHLAVDNALERLYKQNLVRPIRIAANAANSIEPEGRLYFEEVIEDWAKASPGSKEEKDNEKNAVAAWIERIRANVVHDPQFTTIQEKWIKQLERPTPDVKQMMMNIYLSNVNVVAATCLECGRRDFKERYKEGFDVVIVDEASKATPPEMLVPLVLAKKVVIIGDHKQLPPMIDERKIEEVLREIGETQLADELDSLTTSQFEKLFKDADDSVKVTLNTQYRMHNDIMQVINAFYEEEGGLICGIQTDMDKPDFALRGSRHHGLNGHPLISPDDHVIWVEVNTPEINHWPSFSNDGEVEAVRKVLDHLMKSEGFSAYMNAFKKEEDREIGIVSFYGKQVEKLSELIEEYGAMQLPLRLRTVDKFQGMERNIMIVSTVRSNTQMDAPHENKEGQASNMEPKVRKNNDIGFAKDFRRVNVAFSRARRLLIIVGNESHFANNNKNYQNIKSIVGRYGSRIDANQL
jgi:hypothetical protein